MTRDEQVVVYMYIHLIFKKAFFLTLNLSNFNINNSNYRTIKMSNTAKF